MASDSARFPFEKSLKLCQGATADALSTYELFLTFRAYGVREAHPKAFGEFAALFRVLNPCVFSNLILSLYKLGERKTDRVTVFQVIQEAHDLKISSDEEHRLLEEKYKVAHVLWEKVSAIRNRVIGHQDLKTDIVDVFKIADIEVQQLEELAGSFADILKLAVKVKLPVLDWRNHADPLHLNVKTFLTKLNS